MIKGRVRKPKNDDDEFMKEVNEQKEKLEEERKELKKEI